MTQASDLLDRWLDGRSVIVDPFARNCSRGTITNDLDPETQATHHSDAVEFLDMLIEDGIEADAVILDPPGENVTQLHAEATQ